MSQQHNPPPPLDAEAPLQHQAFDDLFSQVLLGKFIPDQPAQAPHPQWPDVPIPQSTAGLCRSSDFTRYQAH
jgi:hypothetical protein